MNIHTSDTESILIAQPSEKNAKVVFVISKSKGTVTFDTSFTRTHIDPLKN